MNTNIILETENLTKIYGAQQYGGKLTQTNTKKGRQVKLTI